MNDWARAERRVERAQGLFEHGQYIKAAEELRSAISINPYNASWHFNLGLTLDAVGAYPQAIEAYRRAVELEPDDLVVLNCLGVDYTCVGRYAESLDCFERIERQDVTYEPAYCNRIITYTEMGDHEQAEVMFYLARQVKDECPLCLYNIANSLFDRSEYHRAIACWQRCLELEPDHASAHARIAETHWALGNLDEARRHYQVELGRSPGDVDTLLDMGELLVEMGLTEEAAEKFRRVLEQSPASAAAHFGLGELALKDSRNEDAEEQFRLVLRIDRYYPGAHMRLGEVLLRGGREAIAGVHLLAELRHAGKDPSALLELGQLLLRAGKTRQANAVLRKLVAIEPTSPQVEHSLAVSYFLMENLEEGILHCRRALKHKPDYPLALYNLALAHMEKGAIVRARRYVAKALAVAPADEQVRALAGRLGVIGFWKNLRRRLLGRRLPRPVRGR